MTQIKGVNWRLIHQGPAEIDAQIGQIAAMGCTDVAVVTSHYVQVIYNPATGDNEIAFPPPEHAIRNAKGQPWLIFPDLGAPQGPYANTPSYELVYYAVSLCRALGMSAIIKPHIDLLNKGTDGNWYAGGWRGYAVLPQTLVMDFIWAYTYRYLAPYVAVAKELGAGLVLGTELYSITKQYGAAFWRQIAMLVRGALGFKGPLTYSANWGGWGDDAEWVRLRDFWSRCDFIGISAYFPLPTIDWHYKPFDWHPYVDDWLTEFAAQVGKPLLFAEWGYPNSNRAATDPMGDPRPDDVQDDALQLELAQAGIDRWAGDPNFAGSMWWEADRGDPAPISHQVKPGTPLAATLFGDKP